MHTTITFTFAFIVIAAGAYENVVHARNSPVRLGIKPLVWYGISAWCIVDGAYLMSR